MSEWNELTIGELPLTIGDGNYSSKYPSAKEFKTSGIPFISNKDIKNGRILSGDLRYIAPEKHAELKKGHIKEHDILVSTRANIGDIAYVDASFEDANINAQLVFLRCDEKTLHSKFLYHLLSSKHYHAIFQNHASGSAQMQLPIAALREISITFPEFDEQESIAAVLGSLDDKIDLLHRQNKTLEAMAASLFRQWFVEEAQEDWDTLRVSDFVDVLSGFAFKSTTFTESGAYRLITIKAVQDGYLELAGADRINEVPSKAPDYCYLKHGDILLSLTGNVGRCCLVDDEGLLLNQRVAKLRAKNKRDWALVYVMFRQSSMKQYLEEMAKGTAQANLSPIETANMEVSLPPIKTLELFSKVATPLLEGVLFNKSQIRTIETLRDTLLPKLMSGEVRVEIN